MPSARLPTLQHLGYLDQDHYLFICGRLKEQYKLTNGKYVVPAPLEDRLKLCPLVANVMIHGENRPYNVALVVPSADSVLEWAAAQGLGHRTLDELTTDDTVRQKFAQEIAALSSGFKHYERVKAFAFITEDFTQQNQMLTPSMKLRPHMIVQRWGDQLERLYRLEQESGGAAADADTWSPAACDG